MSLGTVKNAALYYLKPEISGKLGEALQSQTTGKVDLGKEQVNQAISMQSDLLIEKTRGAIQNIQIANSFLLTAQANLGTVIDNLSTLAGDVMTLLNQTVSTQNNEAAVQKIIESLGMAAAPTTRDVQEGSIIKTLRQGGSGQALYFRTNTTSFMSTNPANNAPPTVDASKTTDTANATITKLTASPFAAGAAFTGDLGATPAITVTPTWVTGNASTYAISVQYGSKTYSMATTKPTDSGPILLKEAGTSTTDIITLSYKTTLPLTTLTTKGFTDDQAGAVKAAALLQADIKQALSELVITPGQMNPAKSTNTGGIVDFKISKDSNYGEGSFTMTYDGTNVEFRDSYIQADGKGTLIQTYPLDGATLKEAGDRSKISGLPIEVSIGSIGTLYVDKNATGVAPTDGGFKFSTQTTDYKATLIVSSSDGSRTIDLPDLTDPVKLWGEQITIEAARLQTDMDYQQQIKGMIDHGSAVVRSAYQSVSNLIGVLEQDQTAQDACMESLQDLDATVSDADSLEVANDVFTYTQQYKQLFEAMKLIASVEAIEQRSANEIAALATS